MSSPDTQHWLQRLEEKYAADGQDTAAYLEGHFYRRYVNYWDYIHLDTLLTLQQPLTDIPDEPIFIIYHQITELYFRLCLHEYEQIRQQAEQPVYQQLLTRVLRIDRYFKALIESFGVMVEGMDKQQFLQFRLSLAPASGFQSVQYRLIELSSTPLHNLSDKEKRAALGESATDDDLLGCLYWRNGATVQQENSHTGEVTSTKTLTLELFERKYHDKLHAHAALFRGRTLWDAYRRLPAADQRQPRLVKAMRQLDASVNVNWPLEHFKSAVRYLERDPDAVAATGGTNWRKYLPPKFQRRIFFPELWTAQETEEWGRGWVEDVLGEQGAGGGC